MTVTAVPEHYRLKPPYFPSRLGTLMRGALGFVLGYTIPARASAQQTTASATSLVFDGVTVVDVEQGKLVPDQRVVITGNRIEAVGGVGTVTIPRNARLVDAKGKYLIPGLWDLHTHSRRQVKFFYPLFIANGVTGFRDASSEVPLDSLIRWRREIMAGTRVGPPRQVLSGPAIDDEPSSCEYGNRYLHACVTDSADARRVVDSLKSAGADMLKTYELSAETYFVIAAEARRLHMPFGGHITASELSAAEVSDSGASIIDHPSQTSAGLDTLCWNEVRDGETWKTRNEAQRERCARIAERFRRNNTWWVPTLVVSAAVEPEITEAVAEPIMAPLAGVWRELADSGLLPRGNWLLRDSSGASASLGPRVTGGSNGNLRFAQEVDLPILTGTDTEMQFIKRVPPGFSVHAELAFLVAEGLTPAAALRTATLNPAKFLRGTDSLGTVAAGKLADLVLLDANPLDDVTNTTTIRAVVANGRYFDRAALDGLLVDARAKLQ